MTNLTPTPNPPDLRHAAQRVTQFVERFGPEAPAYRLLAMHAALPLVLTPDLLNYLRARFLRGQVPWIAEADLLLSDLCRPVGYEQYVLDSDARAYLLAQMKADPVLGAARMQDVARLLLHYVRHLAQNNPYLPAHELQAQQWAAMACLDDQRETVARELSHALQAQVHGSTITSIHHQLELARLLQLVDILSPDLAQYPELLAYAKDVGRFTNPGVTTLMPAEVWKICPSCQYLNSQFATSCLSCHTDLKGVCANCHQQNRPEARFCNNCGKRLHKRPENPSDTFCLNCESENRAGSRFCMVCGYTLGQPKLLEDSPYRTRALLIGHKLPMGAVQNPNGDEYVVNHLIERGEFSEIYQVTRMRDKTIWALKGIDTSSVTDETREQTLQIYLQEAQLLKTLNHPNLPKVIDIFEYEHWQYMVMDFIDGHTLGQLLQQAGSPLSENKVVQWGEQLCEVLHYLHTLTPPIVYRDLKPDNVMIESETDTVKLIDFGIARRLKMEKTGTFAIGTPGYAAPEQYSRYATDARVDIYSLGATLHHLLTNITPSLSSFQFDEVIAYNPNVSQRVNNVIMKAVSVDASKRFDRITSMYEALTGETFPAKEVNKSRLLQHGVYLRDRYRIEHSISQGGITITYRAVDENMGSRIVAIQEILLDDIADSPIQWKQLVQTYGKRFEILANCNHSHIPSISDYFLYQDRLFVVMQYIEGKSLDKLSTPTNQLSQDFVVKIGIQVCDAMLYLHGRPSPILHLNISPRSLILEVSGRIQLVGFSMPAELIEKGELHIGTLSYSAPEQHQGKVEAKTDVYLLAATLYLLLTGDEPANHPFEFPKLSQLPSSLAMTIQKALEIDLSKRLSMHELRDSLAKITSESSIEYQDNNPDQESFEKQKEFVMEPVTLIVTALVAGLAAGVGEVAKAGVKDVYDLFMSRLRGKVAGHEDAQVALTNVEKKPDSEARQAFLQEELVTIGAAQDTELLKLAQDVLKKLDEKGAQAGKYNVNISGGQGIVIGDQAQVTQNFGGKSPK